MSVGPNKVKLIEEAQKHVMRGQFGKAAKAYEQALAIEPSSINLRQKLAENLIKDGRSEDARKEFETIGKHYSNNGFYLKAIAVYKQLQKLFPGDITLSLTLAGLNEKHGLTANALSEYKHVCDYYVKAGNSAEVLKILDIMQAVDPQNISIKIKLAEAYFQHGKKKDALILFSKTALLLLDRGDNDGVSKLNSRVQQLFPAEPDFLLDVLVELVKSGKADSAVNGLQELLRSNPKNKRVWDLIIESYRCLGQNQRVKLAYNHYLKMFPDEAAPMLGLMFCYVAEHDVKGVLELIDRFENKLISAGLLSDLDQIYKALEEIDPLNARIIEGLIRVSKAAGDESKARELTAKLKTVDKASGKKRSGLNVSVSPPGLTEFTDPFPIAETGAPTLTKMQPVKAHVLETADSNLPDAASVEVEPEAIELDDLISLEEDDIEIELIIDDSPFELPIEKTVGGMFDSNDWLDSVGDLFDTISTAPSGVRYGSEMDSSDAQSHFDLGLAFKEMGLYDEAINEFRMASSDSVRRMACLIMQGACLRERGEFDTALNMLNTLLRPDLSLYDSCTVRYELVLTHEAAGNTGEATRLLNEIDSANPNFRDVSTRLNVVNLENSLCFSDDDLRNF